MTSSPNKLHSLTIFLLKKFLNSNLAQGSLY